MLKLKHLSLLFLFFVTFLSCDNSDDAEIINNEPEGIENNDPETPEDPNIPEDPDTPEEDEEKELTIFFVNDQHGQLDNFAKIKHIIDEEKKENPNVILTCSGDIFSGNPVVDTYEEKGYPMIDIMNEVGFDIAVLGNHEFDYGEEILADRINQSEFTWICANIDVEQTNIPEPLEYSSIEIDDLKVTFLGLVETNGKENDIIPSTHPKKVENLTFERPENVVERFADVKETEDADLYIALTHLGISADRQLAEQFPYFDLIIGGHNHLQRQEVYNNIPTFQAGSNLEVLGKIDLTIKNKEITNYNSELINLSEYQNYDQNLKSKIEAYNNHNPDLKTVISYTEDGLSRLSLGCVYTDILRNYGDVDVTIQNLGGIRIDTLYAGNITKEKIYDMDPFGNGFVLMDISVEDLKFFIQNNNWYFYSGVEITLHDNNEISLSINGVELEDTDILKLGTNDYITSVNDSYFKNSGELYPLTTAQSIIYYLENSQENLSYSSCNFK